jgi:enoyl-CoA hydratase/carnithine racemase
VWPDYGDGVPDDDPVLYEVRDPGVALITLNRPDRLNAWTGPLERALYARLETAAADTAVRVIVVTGAGRGFCAGADMEMLQSLGPRERSGADTAALPRTPRFVTTIPKPVIAALNGACAGIGMAFAMMCDLRFAAQGAKITTSFSRRGLIGEYGMAWVLPRVVGGPAALDLLLSARVVLAEDAVGMGLVNRVLPVDALLPESLAYAADLATSCSPASMAAIKRQVWDGFDQSLAEADSWAGQLMQRSLGRDDFREGVQSFVERRAPHFAPLPPDISDLWPPPR